MLRVPHEQQLQLLKLAEMDNELNRLRALVQGTSFQDEAREAKAAVRRAIDAHDLHNGRMDQLQGQLALLERDTNELVEEIQQKEALLHAGEGFTSRELLALQGDIAALKTKQDELETAQLELMSALDTANEQLHKLKRELNEARERASQSTENIKAKLEEANAQGIALRKERDALARQLDVTMVARYETLRTYGSIGVVSMRSDGSLSAGEALGTGEISQLKALPDDVLVEDADRDVLIVRLLSTSTADE